jgi:hypothetical protein
MCPVCWAAALTYFTGFTATGLVAVAGRDRWILFIGVPTAILSALRGWNYVSVPWWVVLLLAAFLLGRITILVCTSKTNLLGALWHKARRLAKRSCPNQQPR